MTDDVTREQKSTSGHHLVQANIARMRAPLDHPIMRGFVDQLDDINAAADRSPGFVWRMQTEEGDATDVRVFDDDQLIFNMSVWKSLEALHRYVYRSEHLGPIRDRQQWFERIDGPHLVLWWVPAGQLPTVEDAERRFEILRAVGPSPEAFTFKHFFEPPENDGPRMLPLELEDCGWAG